MAVKHSLGNKEKTIDLLLSGEIDKMLAAQQIPLRSNTQLDKEKGESERVF